MKAQSVANILKLKRRCDEMTEATGAKTPPPKRMRLEPAATAPPAKQVVSAPSSPVATISAAASTPFAFTIHRPPATIIRMLPLPTRSSPIDSPTNPFGMRRNLSALSLPVALPFGKHLALRLQLVCKDSEDDVYRIVQVPRNYSFRLLHKLILWLLASDARIRARTPGQVFIPYRRNEKRRKSKVHAPLRPRATPSLLEPRSTPCAKGKEKAPPTWMGHYFDVYRKMEMYRSNYKRGVIRAGTGELYSRLSSIREGRIFDDMEDVEDETEPPTSDDVFSRSYTEQSDMPSSPLRGKGEQILTAIKRERMPADNEDDGPEQGWVWEAEDDFTLDHVWPVGLDVRRGIVYHHLPDVSVHITLNTQRLPPRKGKSNVPFLFRLRGGSRGSVRLAHICTPDNLPAEDLVDEQEWEDFSDEVKTERLNIPTSFPNFLRREEQRENPHLTDAVPSPPSPPAKSERNPETPVMRKENRPVTSHARKTSHEELLPPSSPPSLDQVPSLSPESKPVAGSSTAVFPHRSTYPSLDSLVSASSASVASSPFPHPTPAPITLALPTITPHPSHPLRRRRLSRMMRRIERLTHDGLDYLSDREEKEDKDRVEGEHRGEGKTKENDDESKHEEVLEETIVKTEIVKSRRILRVTQDVWPASKTNPFPGNGKDKGRFAKTIPRKRPAEPNSPDLFQALELLARRKQECDFDGDEFFAEDENDLVDSDGQMDGWVKNWNPYDEEEV